MNELPQSILYPDLAHEIDQMTEVDQDLRNRAMAARDDEEVNAQLKAADERNTARMKEIVAAIGWPTISKVGVAGSKDAWLLVQHADHDVGFQKEMLELMHQESESEVSQRNIAYLTDRVAVNEQRPQTYGTQWHEDADDFRPIEDREHVDERRAALGMEPLAEYESDLRKRWNMLKKKK